MKRQMNEISTELQKLTQQLIAFKPVSKHAVGERGDRSLQDMMNSLQCRQQRLRH